MHTVAYASALRATQTYVGD